MQLVTRRPVARAARGLAPDGLEPAPGTVRFTSDEHDHQGRDREEDGVRGSPKVEPPAIDASERSVVLRGEPPEMPRTTPYSRAFMPSVATIGLSPRTPDQHAV